ncbi:MAG: glycosyltransferase family 39 protein [Candidatus Promineifilaceae bacterium]
MMFKLANQTVLLMCVILAVEVFGRIRFPYDLYFASESPFMTNMLKLSQGSPLFTPIEQMNSHIYAPGMEYLFWFIAKPIGLVHDVRFARLLVVVMGVVTALIAGQIIRTVSQNRHSHWVCSGIVALVLFKNFTADMVHPDNFHALHTMMALALALFAARRQSFGWAFVAVLWASVGVLTKQTGVLTVVGVLIGLGIVGGLRRWQISLLTTIGFSTMAAAAAWLLNDEFGRFYTYDLSLLHDIFPAKLLDLPRLLIVMPHKLILILLLPIAIWMLWQHPLKRQFVILWGAIGIFGTGATLIAYLKAFGTWNNLGILDVWMTLPVLIAVMSLDTHKLPRFAFWGKRTFINWRLLGLLALLTLIPLRVPPPPSYYAMMATWEGMVSADLAANKQILIANGTTLLTRNGSNQIPLDRAAAATDLKGAQITPDATHRRIREQVYDRIYLNVPRWYADDTLELLAEQYRKVDLIPAPEPALRYLFGYQKELFESVLVLEPR